MPTLISCPSCMRQLKVPDNLLGKNVKCPTCGTAFSAAAAGAPESVPEPPPLPEEPAHRAVPVPVARPSRRLDDEEDHFDDDYDDRPRRRRRRMEAPHRGSTIMALGIISFFFAPIILGPIAWIMGNTDLKEMRAGRMDRSGEGQTNAGRICGMIATIYGACVILFVCVIFGIALASGAGAAAKAPRGPQAPFNPRR